MDNNLRDSKTPVKLNRKMRMWNKYRNYCIGAAGVLVLLIVCIAAINIMGKSSAKKQENVAVPPTTPAQSVAENITQPATEAPTQDQTTQEQTTKAQEETTTEAPKVSGNLEVEGSAEVQEFSSEDFYSDSVFLGDAVVSGISYYGFLDDSKVVADGNLTTDKALDRVDSVVSSNPSKVFIMLGINDVNYGTRGADVIAENLITLANEIKSSAPSANIYILSVLPVTNSFETRTTNQISQAAINDVNDTVGALAESAGITYIDIASAFKDTTGYLNGDCTTNGSNIVHDYYPYLLNSIAGVVK